MPPEPTHRNTGLSEARTWRPQYRTAMLTFFGVAAAFFLGAAIFGSRAPGLAGVLAVLFAIVTADVWRRGLYEEPTGVKIILGGRLTPRRIQWSDIERFEVQLGAGQSPVTLIRAPDHQPIAVPTFPAAAETCRPQLQEVPRQGAGSSGRAQRCTRGAPRSSDSLTDLTATNPH